MMNGKEKRKYEPKQRWRIAPTQDTTQRQQVQQLGQQRIIRETLKRIKKK